MPRKSKELVTGCSICVKHRPNAPEPMISSQLPDRPWQKVGTDLFERKGQSYLLLIDSFSRYVEIAKLCGTTSPNVTVHLKSMFARHSILELVVSDNGPQFSAHTFAKFTEEYGFTHVTTSPKYPQANGQVERAVKNS